MDSSEATVALRKPRHHTAKHLFLSPTSPHPCRRLPNPGDCIHPGDQAASSSQSAGRPSEGLVVHSKVVATGSNSLGSLTMSFLRTLGFFSIHNTCLSGRVSDLRFAGTRKRQLPCQSVRCNPQLELDSTPWLYVYSLALKRPIIVSEDNALKEDLWHIQICHSTENEVLVSITNASSQYKEVLRDSRCLLGTIPL